MAIIERVASHQGWPLRGVPLYIHDCMCNEDKCMIVPLQVAGGQST